MEEPGDESDGEAEGVEEWRVAADGVPLLQVVADAVAKVAPVVDQVVVGHQGSLGVARCTLKFGYL